MHGRGAENNYFQNSSWLKSNETCTVCAREISVHGRKRSAHGRGRERSVHERGVRMGEKVCMGEE